MTDMVEVKMKTISAGPEGTYGVGDKRMVSKDEAAMLVPDYAEYTVLPVSVPPQPAQEKAVISPEETAGKATPPVEAKKPVSEAPKASTPQTAPWGKQ